MKQTESVAVFGAGIAGLTVAHELVRLGYRISVYESNPEAGGFFRSARLPQHENMPSEYSWHGMGPWYHNLFDLMKQIPLDDRGSVFAKALSRPIDFGIFSDDRPAEFYDEGIASIPKMFRMGKREWVRWSWLMLKTWTANLRSQVVYSRQNAAASWKPLLSERAYRTWRSCFGPWIGSDWTLVSLHQAGRFFMKQLTTRPAHRHPGNSEGPTWDHGAGDGWLLLRGPSSEFWFDPWVRHLTESGVSFFWNETLEELEFNGETISAARLASGEKITADCFVLAANPFATARILAKTPSLAIQPELRKFQPLVQDGPHTQVSFRIAFAEPILFPRERTAVVLADSEFNLTLFAEEQVWKRDVDLGDNVRALWTGTTCTGTVPGRVHGRPVITCTREQFLDEIRFQILACKSLDSMIREANGGRGLAEFEIERIEIWHEWEFSPNGIRPRQPKWVNTTNTQPYLPRQKTPVANLLLAGAHTQTEADLWSIEGAVESGRLAARWIDQRVPLMHQHVPAWVRFFNKLDDLCFAVGAPHVMTLALWGLAAVAVLSLLSVLLFHQS